MAGAIRGSAATAAAVLSRRALVVSPSTSRSFPQSHLTHPHRPQSTSTFFPTDTPTPSPDFNPSTILPKPKEPYHFSTQPTLFLAAANIDQVIRLTRHTLNSLGVLPSASAKLAPEHTGVDLSFLREDAGAAGDNTSANVQYRWLAQNELGAKFNVSLGMGQYRKFTTQLGMVAALLPYAKYADEYIISQEEDQQEDQAQSDGQGMFQRSTLISEPLTTLINIFRHHSHNLVTPSSTETALSDSLSETDKPSRPPYNFLIPYDPFGRMYAVGRRKEASARVWLVPSSVSAAADNGDEVIGSIIMNGKLIGTRSLSDRAHIVRPFVVSETLGEYNVFAMAEGGGHSAQAQAVGLAIGRALAAIEWQELGGHGKWWEALRSQQLLKRDPRMVERKKTGQPKARKAHQWVKR